MSARKKKKIQVVEKPLRYFISSLNTPIGNSVVEVLFSDTQNLTPTVFGSISKNSEFLTSVSSKVTKIIDVKFK